MCLNCNFPSLVGFFVTYFFKHQHTRMCGELTVLPKKIKIQASFENKILFKECQNVFPVIKKDFKVFITIIRSDTKQNRQD